MADNHNEERSRDQGKRPSDVELGHHAGDLEVMEETPGLLLKQEVIVDVTPSDEGTLVCRDHGAKMWCESERERALANNFARRWMRLMGRKSKRVLASERLGNNVMNASLSF